MQFKFCPIKGMPSSRGQLNIDRYYTTEDIDFCLTYQVLQQTNEHYIQKSKLNNMTL